MFVITFEVTPKSTHPQRDEIGGAFVNCWMNRSSIDDAIADATNLIVDAGWVVDEPDQISEVTRADYGDDSDELKYYEQALTDNEVLVFHIFSVVDESE